MALKPDYITNSRLHFWGSKEWSQPGGRKLLVLGGMPEGPGQLVGKAQPLSNLLLEPDEAVGHINLEVSLNPKHASTVVDPNNRRAATTEVIEQAGGDVDVLAYSMGVHSLPTDLPDHLIGKVKTLVMVNPFFNNLLAGDVMDELAPFLDKLMKSGVRVMVLLSSDDRIVPTVRTVKMLNARKELRGVLPVRYRTGDHGITISEIRDWWNKLKSGGAF